MILLDTCALSELAKPRPNPGFMAWFEAQPDEILFVSALTFGEIAKGASLIEPGDRKSRILTWLESVTREYAAQTAVVDVPVARVWGNLTASRKRQGQTLPTMDGLIAATAIHHGMKIATRNASDFEGLGVEIVNPWT